MPNDINELDVTDAGLKGIFGNRFHDETCPEAQYKPTSEDNRKNANAAKKPAQKPAEDLWEPKKPDPNWLDKLKSCTVWAGGFGCLTMLFFSWQQAGLMDESVALPTMLACVALAGYGVGKNTVGGRK
jgi:hypothetical protein